MERFERDGVRLAYRTWGARELPPVLLVHAFTMDSRMWHPVASRIAEEYFVVAPDLRGHGASDAPEDPDSYSIDAYAEDVRALARHLGIDRYALVGCSFGGMVALQLAVDTPEPIAALVLSDTSPAPEHERYTEEFRQREARIRQMEEIARKFGTMELGRRLARELSDPFAAAAVRTRFARLNTEGFVGAARARRTRPNLLPLLRERLTMPVLLVAGAEDPVSCALDLMYTEIPQAASALFKGVGHGVPALAPDRFARLLLEFLRSVEEGRPRSGRRTL